MAKLLFLFLCFFIFVKACLAQNKPDTLVGNETPDCEAVAAISTDFIMYYFARQDPDSAEIVLDDWEAACGTSEPIMRTRILFAIYRDNFSESLYDSTIIDCVIDYSRRMESDSLLYSYYPGDFGFVPVKGEYDYFTQSIADTLLKRIFYNPSELYFSELYANVLTDPFKEIQKDTIYENTGLRSFYYQRVDKYRNEPDFNFNVFTGIWMPFDNAAMLGNHPVLGFQAGYHQQKMTYNFALSFRMGKPKNEYEFLKNGNIDTSNTFFGIYIGADIERAIIKFRKNDIDLLAGVGYEGFDAVKVNTEDNNPDNDISHPIGSVNINFGLGYRYNLSNNKYFALQGKYNFVNYDNHGGTNFSGNNITISLMYGGFFSEKKDRMLKSLGYIE